MEMLREDNDAAIRVMTTGRNPTMKQLHRVHGVSISSLHEIAGKYQKSLVALEYCPTDQMKADIYTKPFVSGPKSQHALSLIGIQQALPSSACACVPCDVAPLPTRRSSVVGKGKGFGDGRGEQA